MIKLTDYLIHILEESGIEQVFMITGGGAMHLNDSFGKSQKIAKIYNHHEQACAIAAEGYARVSGKIPVVNVTTGPGGLNTLTGVMGQWTDSVPVLYISGQVKFETTLLSCPEIPLRQLGDQEVNIVEIVKPITKFAEVLTDPSNVRYVLEKALHIATHGRPGPVWIDIPMNVQGAMIEEDKLIGFNPSLESGRKQEDLLKINIAIDMLLTSMKPLVVVGHGIRIAKAEKQLNMLLSKLNVPCVTTFNGFDLLTSDHENYVGRIGTIGNRAGNFTLQNADLILSIGSRNNIRQVSYNWKDFARSATKIVVDIDAGELEKPILVPNLAINMDAGAFLEFLSKGIQSVELPDWSRWLRWCMIRKQKYPVVLDEYRNKTKLNPYLFMEELTSILEEGSTIVAGNGTACVALFQAGIVKKGQRIFWNSGCAAMGYDLPAAIGASVAKNRGEAICLAGDGSFQMNIQELTTMVHNQLPVKIFYLNNDGYSSIRQTQSNFFEGRLTGANPASGVGFPDIRKVAESFGIKTFSIGSEQDLKGTIRQTLLHKGPALCEVLLDPDGVFSPKVSSEKMPDGRMVSKPLEDMYPFLTREEYSQNFYHDEEN